MGDESVLETNDFAWPDVARLCFGPGDDPRMDADIAWCQGRRDMFCYAEGYRRVAEKLVDSMPLHERNPDYLVWPLAFLWRHYIELMLKDIISKGREIEDRAPVFPEHHKLLELWREARPHIAQCGSDDTPELINVEAALSDFEQVDPGAMGFRYPCAKGGGRSLPNAPECINLLELNATMKGLANFFDACRDMMSAHLDSLREMNAWYR